jgi:small-conductance mechanosensitive channel
MKKITAYLLIILSISMIYIGIAYRMVPPALTAVGFLAIAITFITDKKEKGQD